MNNQELIAMLKRAAACAHAVEWVGQRDLKTAWAECQRADWMVWGLALMTGKPGWSTHKELVSIAVFCARRAYRFVYTDPNNRLINCIKAVDAWVENPCEETRGEATRVALKVAYTPYSTGSSCSVVNSVINLVPHLDASIFDVARSVAYAVNVFRMWDDTKLTSLCDHIRQTVNIPI